MPQAYGMPRGNMTRNLRLAQLLQQQQQAAGPVRSNTQGMAQMLRSFLAGQALRKDASEMEATQEAFMRGVAGPELTAGPGTPPSAEYQGNVPPSGLQGGIAALQGVGGERGRNLRQQLQMLGMGQQYKAGLAKTAREDVIADTASERTWEEEQARTKLSGKKEIAGIKTGSGPFRGTGMEAQQRNILAGGDTSSQAYAAAYASLAAPKTSHDPITGAVTTVTPDMSMYAPPTFAKISAAKGAPQQFGAPTIATQPGLPKKVAADAVAQIKSIEEVLPQIDAAMDDIEASVGVVSNIKEIYGDLAGQIQEGALEAYGIGLPTGEEAIDNPTGDARQRLRILREDLMTSMRRSGRIPVQEQNRILRMLPSPETWVKAPARAKRDLQQLRERLSEQLQSNKAALSGLPQGVSEDDILETMRANSMTREQVMQRLKR